MVLSSAYIFFQNQFVCCCCVNFLLKNLSGMSVVSNSLDLDQV